MKAPFVSVYASRSFTVALSQVALQCHILSGELRISTKTVAHQRPQRENAVGRERCRLRKVSPLTCPPYIVAVLLSGWDKAVLRCQPNADNIEILDEVRQVIGGDNNLELVRIFLM